MSKVLVIIILLVLIPCYIFAQQVTGMELLRGCTSIIKQTEGKELSPDESLDSLFWLGYLAGFNDSTTINYAITKDSPVYCTPKDGVQTEQLSLIVHKYLKNHPEVLNESARSCVLAALMEAFPCNR